MSICYFGDAKEISWLIICLACLLSQITVPPGTVTSLVSLYSLQSFNVVRKNVMSLSPSPANCVFCDVTMLTDKYNFYLFLSSATQFPVPSLFLLLLSFLSVRWSWLL